jgi:hypothetical protein
MTKKFHSGWGEFFLNAKAQRRKDAGKKQAVAQGVISSLPLVFFASLRLCAFAFKFTPLENDPLQTQHAPTGSFR